MNSRVRLNLPIDFDRALAQKLHMQQVRLGVISEESD